MPKVRAKKSKKRSFHGNRYTVSKSSDNDMQTASLSKLNIPNNEVHNGSSINLLAFQNLL